MSYQMRRSEKQKDRNWAYEVIDNTEFATIGAVLPDGLPYVFVVTHGRAGDCIYFHSAAQGLKCEAIEANPSVCVSWVGDNRVLAEQFSTEYKSATAFGKAVLVTDGAEMVKGFEAICGKVAPGHDWKKYCGGETRGVKLYRIDIEDITGKQNRE